MQRAYEAGRPCPISISIGNPPFDDGEIAKRRASWQPNPPRYTSGVLGKYAKLVQGAETGAITNTL